MTESTPKEFRQTDLCLRIFQLEDNYKNLKRTRYQIECYPSRLIYLPEIHKCNPFIQKYAYTHIFTNEELQDVADKIIGILEEAKEFDVRVDIIHNRQDQAHLSKEYLNTGTSYIICNNNGVSYNRNLAESQFYAIAQHIKAYYQQQWNNETKEQS
jgi:hypothetical protein